MAYTDNNGLTPVVKLRLVVVGAVIGGPPVAMRVYVNPSVKPSVCKLPFTGFGVERRRWRMKRNRERAETGRITNGSE